VLNYSWREYGNRVGAWRCLELFDALGLPAAALVNTALYDHCPELVAACVARGDELVGHGHSNAERQGVSGRSRERELLRACRERMQRESGQAPGGWLSPWISESLAHARPAGRNRLPLHAELVPRRPAACRCAHAGPARCGRCPTRRSSTTSR
jgi:peptidoglycan/xylan/chitin deacetylase (PgdA/CDA1 family)